MKSSLFDSFKIYINYPIFYSNIYIYVIEDVNLHEDLQSINTSSHKKKIQGARSIPFQTKKYNIHHLLLFQQSLSAICFAGAAKITIDGLRSRPIPRGHGDNIDEPNINVCSSVTAIGANQRHASSSIEARFDRHPSAIALSTRCSAYTFGKVTVIPTSLRNFKVDLVPYSSLFQFLLYSFF